MRGAKVVGLAAVPVIVRELSDVEAEEIHLLENLGRENLTPVEQAQAFKRMLDLKGGNEQSLYTQETLAKKVGCHEWEIRQALKILAAPASILEALDVPEDQRKITVKAAAMIGRIPDTKAREQAAKRVLTGHGVDGGPATGVPLKQEEVAKLIKQEFTAKITGFDLKDANLLPVRMGLVDGVKQRVSGGACLDCPYRSGCMTDLEDGVRGKVDGKRGTSSGIDPNLCTKPSCLAEKRDAQWNMVSKAHLKEGGRVLSAAEAKKELQGDDLSWGSAYVELNSKPNWSDFQGRSNLPAWKELLKGSEYTVTLARGLATGKELKLVNKKEVIALVKAKWKGGSGSKDSKVEDEAKAARARQLKNEKIDALIWQKCLRAVQTKVAGTGLSVDQWPALFEIIIRAAGSDGQHVLGQYLQIKLSKEERRSGSGRDFGKAIIENVKQNAISGNGWLSMCVVTAIARSIKYSGPRSMELQAMMEALEIDDKPLRKEASTEINELLKAKKKTKPEAKGKKAKGEVKPVKDKLSPFDEPVKPFVEDEEVWSEEKHNELPEDLVAEASSNAPAKPRKERVAAPDDEAKGREAYLRTGSLKKAAEETEIPLGTLQNWHKRRKWKALLDAGAHTEGDLELKS